MDYTSNTDKDIELMLKEIGVKDIMDLFRDIPDNIILKEPLKIPDQLSEFELLKELEDISKENKKEHRSLVEVVIIIIFHQLLEL